MWCVYGNDDVARARNCLRNDTVEKTGGGFARREQDDREVKCALSLRGFASYLKGKPLEGTVWGYKASTAGGR